MEVMTCGYVVEKYCIQTSLDFYGTCQRLMMSQSIMSLVYSKPCSIGNDLSIMPYGI